MLAELTPMILAAGHATRLRPLSERRAKAVVPFLNRPLLDHTLEWLARAGFDRVVVNLHHAADSIVRRYGREAFGLRIDYSPEPDLLGTGGGPRAALPLLGERVLIVNGDVVGLLALGPLLRHHEDSGALATLALHRGEAADGYPRVIAARNGPLLAFPGDPDPGDGDHVAGVFTGLHVVERALLEQLPEGVFSGIIDPLYRALQRQGQGLHAVAVPGPWYEVGDPQRYIDNQLRALELGDVPLGVAGLRRWTRGGYLSRHAHLENVRPVSPFLLGAGVRFRHGSSVEHVVLGDRTRIGPSCRLRRVVTWPRSWIGRGCRLTDVVVMEGVRVEAGTRASGTVFTPAGPVPFGAALAAVGSS